MMNKGKIFLKSRPFRVIISILIIAVIVTPTWIFLDSIHYKVLDYFFSWGPGQIRDFGEHKKEFELLIEKIDDFVENNPNFSENFTGECDINEEGLIFLRIGAPYPENKVFEHFTVQEWQSIKNYVKVFPHDFYYSDIFIDKNYPNYIMFRSDERSARVLVYTRGGRPNELIDSYWEKFEFVRVKRVANGWYDIAPR
ncbi:MAG: hypothetical protein HFE39_05055 [Clostridiales bacterium]|jgi:hypothetical protein|nr:hypothetical protein [Clostridiales bacterium]